MPVLPRLNNYDDIYRQFRWDIPARYNIGVDICDRWALNEPDRLAILHVHADGREDALSYGALRDISNRLANVLRALGVKRGDRVAIMLPQMPEVAAAHIAIYKLGAVALADRCPVRPRCAVLPSAEFRRQGAADQRARPRQARRRSQRDCRILPACCRSTAPTMAPAVCRLAGARLGRLRRRSTPRPTIRP